MPIPRFIAEPSFCLDLFSLYLFSKSVLCAACLIESISPAFPVESPFGRISFLSRAFLSLISMGSMPSSSAIISICDSMAKRI